MSKGTLALGRRSRITRQMLIDAFRATGEMTRSDLQQHFSANITTVQMHLSAMRDERKVYICGWREPISTGMWSPIYALRVNDENDVPHPPPQRRTGRYVGPDEDPGQPIVVMGHGLKKEHALIVARVRSERLDFGHWGGLFAPASARRSSASSRR